MAVIPMTVGALGTDLKSLGKWWVEMEIRVNLLII